jgi:hypothetical protein
MNNFERSLGKSRDEKSYSAPVNLEYAHHENLHYGIMQLNAYLERSIKHPDKERVIYEHATSNVTGTSFDIDTIRQDDRLQALGITVYGGAIPFTGSYHYSEALSAFVETTNYSDNQRLVESNNLVRMLSDQFPDIDAVQKLLDRPIDSPEMIDRALSGFAKQKATRQIRSCRYSNQDLFLSSLGDEHPNSDYASDRLVEFIVTDINNHSTQYQLDTSAPYEVHETSFRRAINYQFQTDSITRTPLASCMSHLLTQDDITRAQSIGYMKIQPNEAYEDLLAAITSLKRSAEI